MDEDSAQKETPTSDASEQDVRPRDQYGVRNLLVWKSLSRKETKYPKEFFTTIAAISFLVSVICAFFQEWLLILVVWSIVFLAYALTKVPPEETEHKITTHGITSLGHSYIWSELGPFWFVEKDGVTMLHVAHVNIFGQLMMIVDDADKNQIRDILADYLPFIEYPRKSASEKIADWFVKRFPLEKVVMGKIETMSKAGQNPVGETAEKKDESPAPAPI